MHTTPPHTQPPSTHDPLTHDPLNTQPPQHTTPSTHNPLTLWSWTPWTSSSSPRDWCHRYDDLGGLPRISASVAPAASACFGTPAGLCPHVLWFLWDKGSVTDWGFHTLLLKGSAWTVNITVYINAQNIIYPSSRSCRCHWDTSWRPAELQKHNAFTIQLYTIVILKGKPPLS